MSHSQFRQPALLVIDMQVGLFHGPIPVYEAEAVLSKVSLLIQRAHAASVPVFAARHTGPPGSPIEHGSANWQLMPGLPLSAEKDRIFEKTKPSCFQETDLREQLQAAGIRELLICGLKTQFCIDSNCRAAAALGFDVVLIEDAHSCNDTSLLPASSIIAHHNMTLSALFARPMKAAEVLFS